MLDKMVRQQPHKGDEQFGGALALQVMPDGLLHHVHQVEQEKRIECAEAFFEKTMGGALIKGDLLHAFSEMSRLRSGEVDDGPPQFGCGIVGRTNHVAHHRRFKRQPFVGKKADGAVIL